MNRGEVLSVFTAFICDIILSYVPVMLLGYNLATGDKVAILFLLFGSVVGYIFTSIIALVILSNVGGQ